MHKVINGALFQGLWFAAIFQGWELGLLALVLLLGHWCYETVKTSTLFPLGGELMIPAVVALVGATFDALYTRLGIYHFEPGVLTGYIIETPLWLLFLWVGFGLTITRSLSWLSNKGLVFVFLSGLVGTLSYMSGRALGVVEFSNYGLAAVAMQWLTVGTVIFLMMVVQKNSLTAVAKSADSPC